jgi:3-dehydroquinate synthase
MKEISISTASKNYSVIVGSGILTVDNVKEFYGREILLVIDPNIEMSVKEKSIGILQDMSSKFLKIEIEASEINKSNSSLGLIHDALIENNYSRDCILFALGGGIICDLTGFAAATYQRGVDFVLIPSTLLSQVDASVGGKTAINHPKGKNMIGAFHQPSKVLSDTNLLLSLNDKQIREGLAEIIKHALIIDDGFFDWLSENIDTLLKSDQEKLLEAIARSIKIKSEVVAKDETEQGVRKWLNLGHTFGHAIELYGEYRDFSHGESVALGAIMATNLSERVLNLDKKEGQKIRKLFSSILTEELLNTSFDENKLLQLMSSDKKRKGNDLNFILMNKIGDPQIVSSPEELHILESIKIS